MVLGWMDGSDRRPTPGSRQRAVPVPRRSPYTAQMRVSPQPMGYPIGVGIGAIGVHTSGTSSPGSSARHPTVRASSRRREATGTCLDEVTPLGPTPEGRPIKAGIHPLHAPWPLQTPPPNGNDKTVGLGVHVQRTRQCKLQAIS